MTDNMPESCKDGSAAYGAAREAGVVSDARARKVDPAELGPAFPRTHHVLWLEFGNRQDFNDRARKRTPFAGRRGSQGVIVDRFDSTVAA